MSSHQYYLPVKYASTSLVSRTSSVERTTSFDPANQFEGKDTPQLSLWLYSSLFSSKFITLDLLYTNIRFIYI